jgi:hypothetical protein|nr:MAG TPA: hypothetical protein [Caudoviricetes sp.]
MGRDEQIKIVKQLRERFEDDVYSLLQDWVDALDEAGTGDELPGEPLMDEYTRVFKAKDVIGSFDDIESEYLPEERWFGYPEFKPQQDQICIFRYIDEGFNFYDVDFYEGRTWRLREKTIFAFMPIASPKGFHRRR